MGKARVVIIGAGVLGLFTAVELLKSDGYDVLVLDKAHPGEGSSGRSVGMVETQYFDSETVEVRAYARRVFEELENENDLTFNHGGYLRLGHTDDDLVRFKNSLAIQESFGIRDVEILSPAEIGSRWPQLITEGLTGGLYGEWDGYVDGHEVCQKLTEIVRENGGKVLTGKTVTSAEHAGEEWQIFAGNEVFLADFVVNAAGAHAGVIGEILDAPVPLLPQLHGAITVKLPDLRSSTPFVMDYMPGSGIDGVYFRSEGDTHFIAGLHTEEAISESVSPDTSLKTVADDVLERIVMLLLGRVRDAEDLELDRSWEGIYPMTPDHHPVAGKYPDSRGVICALGGGGSGIQLGPAIGKVAADAIRGVTKDAFGIAPKWAPARF